MDARKKLSRSTISRLMKELEKMFEIEMFLVRTAEKLGGRDRTSLLNIASGIHSKYNDLFLFVLAELNRRKQYRWVYSSKEWKEIRKKADVYIGNTVGSITYEIAVAGNVAYVHVIDRKEGVEDAYYVKL